ncbi:MAG: cytochrome C oxidase subunit IV family protein [Thermaerobacter sp.]
MHGHADHVDHSEHQAHLPVGVYLRVWFMLFILSAVSYFVDYFQVEPLPLRWVLIVLLALIKAALIMNYFMHLGSERLSLVYTILLPPVLILALAAIVIAEGSYTSMIRALFGG